MITVFCYDGATSANITRAKVPGMDELTWIPTDMENEFLRQRYFTAVPRANKAMLTRDKLVVAPWPGGIYSQQPIDNTARYANFPLHLGMYDQFSQTTVPLCHRYISDGNYSSFTPERAGVNELAPPDEVRWGVEDPTNWLRLPFTNEHRHIGMKNQLCVLWDGLSDNAYKLSLDENMFYTPFDLTDSETYGVYEADGATRISNGHANLHPGSVYVVGLRPRTWRIVARTIAYYYRVTPFFIELFSVEFITMSYNRPPIYPYRHDVHHSVQYSGYEMTDYWGNVLSYDYGIYYQFANSRAAALLRTQISLEQSYDRCMVYVVAWVEPATLYVDTEEPMVGEIVCTITRRDTYGEVSTVVVKQEKNTSYGRQPVGMFYSDFYYTGGAT